MKAIAMYLVIALGAHDGLEDIQSILVIVDIQISKSHTISGDHKESPFFCAMYDIDR